MKTAFVFCLLLKGKWYGNVNYSNIAVGICILIDSIDKYSKWHLWMLHQEKNHLMHAFKKNPNNLKFCPQLCFNKISNLVGLGRVFKRMLAPVSVGWCDCAGGSWSLTSAWPPKPDLRVCCLRWECSLHEGWIVMSQAVPVSLFSVLCGQAVVWEKEGLCPGRGPYKI